MHEAILMDNSPMPTNDTLQRLIASRLTPVCPEEVVERAVQLWLSLASELIPIIGEAGFAIIYTRSLRLNQSVFPWLPVGSVKKQADSLFTSLATSLKERTHAETGEACQALLLTFTDMLVVLIGEPITTSILRAAWGDDTPETTSKDYPHE